MSTCSALRLHAAKLDDLQRQLNGIGSAIATVTEVAGSLEHLQTSDGSTTALISALIGDPNGKECRSLAGGTASAVAQVLPGGRDFAVCQPAGGWASTATQFADLLPAGAAWKATATPGPVCTPLPGTDLFAGAVLCAASLPEALAYGVDLRTVRQRRQDAAPAPDAGDSAEVDVSICMHKDTMGFFGSCSNVKQDACDVTSMFNGVMCKWKDNKCMTSKQAGDEILREQCAKG